MTRRPGTGGTRRQAWNAASPASGLDRLANRVRLRPVGRPRPVVAPAGRRRAGPADEGGDRRGPAARTRRARRFGGGRPADGEARSHEKSTDEDRSVRPGRRRDAGTGTADPGRPRSRPQAGRPSRGNSASRGRPSNMLSPARNATAARRSDGWFNAMYPFYQPVAWLAEPKGMLPQAADRRPCMTACDSRPLLPSRADGLSITHILGFIRVLPQFVALLE